VNPSVWIAKQNQTPPAYVNQLVHIASLVLDDPEPQRYASFNMINLIVQIALAKGRG
jgi:hypothetical protein